MKQSLFTKIFCTLWISVPAAVAIAVLCGCNSKSTADTPQVGDRYEVIGPTYLRGVYRNLNKRELNNELAWGSLSAIRVSGPEVAFEEQVPIGTIMTITRAKPDRFVLDSPLWVPERIVTLDPDPSRGLDVTLSLHIGIEGELDGLNPKLFRKLPPAPDVKAAQVADEAAVAASDDAPHKSD